MEIILILNMKYYQRSVAKAVWILLLLCLLFYVVKEAFKAELSYLRRLDTYRNLATITSTILVIYKTRTVFSSSDISLARWQFHLASVTCLLLWLETAALFGRVPVLGKYLHMFW